VCVPFAQHYYKPSRTRARTSKTTENIFYTILSIFILVLMAGLTKIIIGEEERTFATIIGRE